jgi:hypothetical protein
MEFKDASNTPCYENSNGFSIEMPEHDGDAIEFGLTTETQDYSIPEQADSPIIHTLGLYLYGTKFNNEGAGPVGAGDYIDGVRIEMTRAEGVELYNRLGKLLGIPE